MLNLLPDSFYPTSYWTVAQIIHVAPARIIELLQSVALNHLSSSIHHLNADQYIRWQRILSYSLYMSCTGTHTHSLAAYLTTRSNDLTGLLTPALVLSGSLPRNVWRHQGTKEMYGTRYNWSLYLAINHRAAFVNENWSYYGKAHFFPQSLLYKRSHRIHEKSYEIFRGEGWSSAY